MFEWMLYFCILAFVQTNNDYGSFLLKKTNLGILIVWASVLSLRFLDIILFLWSDYRLIVCNYTSLSSFANPPVNCGVITSQNGCSNSTDAILIQLPEQRSG